MLLKIRIAPRLPPMYPRLPPLYLQARPRLWNMRLRRLIATAATHIANVLRFMDWTRRHLHYKWLCHGDRELAALVAAVMSPDELLVGTSTGARPECVIPLNDGPRPPAVHWHRVVRPRRASGLIPLAKRM